MSIIEKVGNRHAPPGVQFAQHATGLGGTVDKLAIIHIQSTLGSRLLVASPFPSTSGYTCSLAIRMPGQPLLSKS